jgi:1,2-diacylglycerol 3-alpha-glucosyltransferase
MPPVIGIVSYWFNRGQATVARQIRTIFDDLGYKTQVLARPTKDSFVLPGHISSDDVWNQPGITSASNYLIDIEEYREWALRNNINVIFFDQNYQFDEIQRLREEGIITIGRFVWESFSAAHVAAAKRAFSCIYSLTRCEQNRYKKFGIDSPHLSWGWHPELEAHRQKRINSGKDFMYVGGYMSTRKPTAVTLKAFSEVDDASLRLTVKTQRPLLDSDFVIPENFAAVRSARKKNKGDRTLLDSDPRIKVVEQDMSTEEYLNFFASTDVALAPSRWEGLGLHLYEGLGLGIPTISCDIEPINEVITHDIDGLLVPCREIGQTKSGIPIYEPNMDGLRDAIKKLSNPGIANEMAQNTAQSRERWSWEKTKSGYQELLTMVSGEN